MDNIDGLELLRRRYCCGPCGQSAAVLRQRAETDEILHEAIAELTRLRTAIAAAAATAEATAEATESINWNGLPDGWTIELDDSGTLDLRRHDGATGVDAGPDDGESHEDCLIRLIREAQRLAGKVTT